MARAKTTARKRTATRKRKTTRSRRKSSDNLTNFFVPLVLMIGIVVCLGAIMYLGLRTASASSFFKVEEIKIEGNRRITHRRLDSIVRKASAEGIWDADLNQIRAEIEKISYIRHASVTRVLPSQILVRVEERRAIAIARINDKYVEIDSDGSILGDAPESGKRGDLFVLLGWDTSLGEKAAEDNLKRLELYQELIGQWRRYDLVSRVSAVDLESTRSVEAFVIDSGARVSLLLGNEDFANRLKEGLEIVAGKGKRIEKVNLDSTSPIISYRE